METNHYQTFSESRVRESHVKTRQNWLVFWSHFKAFKIEPFGHWLVRTILNRLLSTLKSPHTQSEYQTSTILKYVV
jgi:hypothetical protein